jgi:hypothetical protein
MSELEQRFSIHFEIDERAFNEAMVKEVGLIFVAESPLPKMHQVPLLHVLNLILVRLDSKTGLENGVTFLIRDASIVITTVDAARRKILGNSDQPLPHLVTRNFENKRLDLALRELSKIGQGGYLNVVLDTRAAEQAKTPVSGFFNNAPLDTVVRLLADMANLTVVRLDNILYVTTPENAKKWGAAPGNLRPGPEPQKKAKVP